MPTSAAAYAAPSAAAPLEKYTVTRRDPDRTDVVIDIEYAGICHSDIHTVRDEWGAKKYPLVPGHEIVGRVRETGPDATKFAVGDLVGVGCLVDSDRTCPQCQADLEQYCDKSVGTYGNTDRYGEMTQGGYSTSIVVEERFVVRVPESLDTAAATPLLCAGATLYSPLRHWKVGPGSRVGVIGLGGLGHVGVKLAVAMGAEVTVLSHSEKKREDAERFGATRYVNSTDEAAMKDARRSLDLILNTVSAKIDLAAYMNLLDVDGTLVELGLPSEEMALPVGALIGKRRAISGSMIAGLAETQEMLDFCAEHGIVADIELITADRINEAYDRVVASDVRYRFVIDAKTF